MMMGLVSGKDSVVDSGARRRRRKRKRNHAITTSITWTDLTNDIQSCWCCCCWWWWWCWWFFNYLRMHLFNN
jgi:hypothetical protein